MIASTLKFASVVLLVAGGSIFLFSVTPLVVGLKLRLREQRMAAIRGHLRKRLHIQNGNVTSTKTFVYGHVNCTLIC